MADDLERRIANLRRGLRARDELYEILRRDVVERIRHELPDKLRPRLDPEDVYQEAFLRALQHLDDFEWRGEDSFRTFILRVARNYWIDTLRRRSADQTRLTERSGDGSPLDRVADAGERASELLRRDDQIETYLARLRPDEAEVVRLRMLEGLPFADVGARLKKSEEAARKAFNRAMERLSRNTGCDGGG